jgi:hypothetical protein
VADPPRRPDQHFTPDAARWEAIQALFHQVADLRADQQSAALARAAEGDPALAAAVRELLEEDARGTGSALDAGLGALASGVLEPMAAPIPDGAFGPYRLLRLLGEGRCKRIILRQCFIYSPGITICSRHGHKEGQGR